MHNRLRIACCTQEQLHAADGVGHVPSTCPGFSCSGCADALDDCVTTQRCGCCCTLVLLMLGLPKSGERSTAGAPTMLRRLGTHANAGLTGSCRDA